MKDFNFDRILRRIKNIHKRHTRHDIEFQMNIVMSQLGDISRFVTHDNKLCPGVRPHGDKLQEQDAYGHALAQLLIAAHIRGIDVKEALDLATKNMEDQDWKSRKGNNNGGDIKGDVAHIGSVVGIAFVDHYGEKLHELNDHILVINHARPDLVVHTSRLKGIITNHGGKYSHAAIIAREYNIPCIVGTGNATDLIEDGKKIKLDADKEKGGTVYLKVKDEK